MGILSFTNYQNNTIHAIIKETLLKGYMPDYTLELIFIITVASTVIQLILINDKLSKKQKRFNVIL